MRDQSLVTVAGTFDNSLSMRSVKLGAGCINHAAGADGGTASTFVAVVSSTSSQLISQQQSPASFRPTTAHDSPTIGGGFSGGYFADMKKPNSLKLG